MARGFEQNEAGEWVPFDDDLVEPPDPRKDCPWKCKADSPSCLCMDHLRRVLENPPEPNEALKRLMRIDQQVGKE